MGAGVGMGLVLGACGTFIHAAPRVGHPMAHPTTILPLSFFCRIVHLICTIYNFLSLRVIYSYILSFRQIIPVYCIFSLFTKALDFLLILLIILTID